MTGRGRYSPANLIRSADLPSVRGTCVRLPARLDNAEVQAQWQEKLRDPSVPKIVDLFAGAGGMSEGFVEEGFTVAAALDHDQFACESFAANIPAKVICTDISSIENPTAIINEFDYSAIDVIVGGPPCQGFSTVGRARILSLEEEQQQVLLARNELYQQYFRFIEHFRPAFFVMENVPALLNFNDGAYFTGIQEECERLGYVWEHKTINAADYGVPQLRRRLIVIGSRVGRIFRWPRATHEPVTLRDAIGDLPVVQAPSMIECLPYEPQNELSRYQQLMRSRVPAEDRDKIYDHLVRPVREDDRHIFSLMQPGHRYIDIPEEYRRYNSASFKDKYYKLLPDQACVTITAHMARDGYRYIHWDNNQCRTLSVREAARAQSFGDHYRFAGFRSSRFRQIGNAVPPLMARAIAGQILLAWKRSKGLTESLLQLGLPGYEHVTTLVGTSDD